MRRKNTEASVGTLVGAALLIAIMLLMAAAVLICLVKGSIRLFDPGRSLFLQILGWIIFLSGAGLLVRSVSASVWLWGTEIGNAVKGTARGRWKRPLIALALFGLIASGPWLIPIHLEGFGDPAETMLLYAVYLFFAGLVTIAPCALIYGLGRSLAEKEMEKEELDEARKY